MDNAIKVLGKVRPTRDGAWDRNREYEDLSMVYDETTLVSYISKKPVPVGVNITNREYWQPNNVSGYANTNVIIIDDKTESGTLKSYNLETAIKSIPDVVRKPGTMICFYNSNEDIVGMSPSWELWLYNNINVDEWEDVHYWLDCLHKYVYSTFVGWLLTKDVLLANYPRPVEGMMAFVGTDTSDSYMYVAEYDEYSDIIAWSRRNKLSDELITYTTIMQSVNLTVENLMNQVRALNIKVVNLEKELKTIKNSM